MSVKEISRRLIGGVWETGVADEGGGGNGDGLLLLATPSYSSTDILGADSSFPTLVETPGPGKLIMPVLVLMRVLPGNTPYVFPGPAAFEIGWGSTLLATTSSSVFFDATEITTSILSPPHDLEGIGFTDAQRADQPLIWGLAGPLIDGDGTLKTFVYYTVVTL